MAPGGNPVSNISVSSGPSRILVMLISDPISFGTSSTMTEDPDISKTSEKYDGTCEGSPDGILLGEDDGSKDGNVLGSVVGNEEKLGSKEGASVTPQKNVRSSQVKEVCSKKGTIKSCGVIIWPSNCNVKLEMC